MNFLWIALVIILLYYKTYKYKYVIDDACDRSDYLTVLTDDAEKRKGDTKEKVHEFYCQVRDWRITTYCIGMLILSSWTIYLIWGWQASLLFAVYYMNVNTAAWKIGSIIYMTNAFLFLTAHYFVVKGWPLLGIPFFWTSIECALSSMTYPFYLLMIGNLWGLAFFVPLVIFMTGKRFQAGLNLRKGLNDNMDNSVEPFTPKKIIRMVKVLGYYIMLSLTGTRTGFFHEYAWVGGTIEKPDRLFWLNFFVTGLFIIWAFPIDWKMTVWWFAFMGLYSQWKNYGMFIAERYTVLGNVAMCVLIAKFFWPAYQPLFWVLCTYWACRSFEYIRAYKDSGTLFSYSMVAHPMTSENYNNLGGWYINEKNYMEAIKPFLLAYRLSQHGERAYCINFNLAICFHNVGMHQKALEHLMNAKQFCPKANLKNVNDMEVKIRNKINLMKENFALLRQKKII